MKIRIHRGSHQIGGSIVELCTGTTHLFIDFGAALGPGQEETTDARMIEMMRSARCDAVLFSHYHGDHTGLLGSLPERDAEGKLIRIGMGKTARRVMQTIHDTLQSNDRLPEAERRMHRRISAALSDPARRIDYVSGRSFVVGDFTVTPLLVDHSAWDAYLFVVEDDGKAVVHTGDFRTHGRLGGTLFDELGQLLRGKNVSVLITEGTGMSRLREAVLTESAMEEKAVAVLGRQENRCSFLLCSSTNMESLATFANASMRLGRAFYVNDYVYRQIQIYRETAGRDAPAFLFRKTYRLEGMTRYNPKLRMTQPSYMRENGFMMLIGVSPAYGKWIDAFRGEDPLLIYSLWKGYVDNTSDAYDARLGALYHSWRPERRLALHTGGHASAEELTRMIRAVRPRDRIVPIHTANPEGFAALDLGPYAEKLHLPTDGETLEV